MWEDFPGSRDATAYWSAEQTKCRKRQSSQDILLLTWHSCRNCTLKELMKESLEERREKKRLGIVRNTIVYSVEHNKDESIEQIQPCIKEDEPVDGQQHQPDGGNAGALARPRAIRDHLTPILDDLNPGIVAPEIQAAHFELKPVMFNMLNSIGQFGGSPHEDARQHIRAFLEVCDSFRQQGVHEDVLKLKLFPTF
ncbi:hypothetical protein GQ457_08G027330 [Hibiscus cannabinus]